jgi:hypothetical protein
MPAPGRQENCKAIVGQTVCVREIRAVPFLKLPFDASMRVYGLLGDFWGEKPEAVGLPARDYLYWQIGLVTSV